MVSGDEVEDNQPDFQEDDSSLVEANKQHPKYTARALRLCGLVSLVQTAVQGNDLQRKSSAVLYRPSMVLVD